MLRVKTELYPRIAAPCKIRKSQGVPNQRWKAAAKPPVYILVSVMSSEEERKLWQVFTSNRTQVAETEEVENKFDE
jgi:hypothetical protein